MLEWLSVWSKVQIVSIWSSWCHCIPQPPSSLASFKSRVVLPFWYWLTQVIMKKRPLNGCSSSSSTSSCYLLHYAGQELAVWQYEWQWFVAWGQWTGSVFPGPPDTDFCRNVEYVWNAWRSVLTQWLPSSTDGRLCPGCLRGWDTRSRSKPVSYWLSV